VTLSEPIVCPGTFDFAHLAIDCRSNRSGTQFAGDT
jgi:hypothetical protein